MLQFSPHAPFWALLLGNWLRTVFGNSSVLCQHTVSCSNIFAITLCTISTLGLSLAWDYLSSFSRFKMPTLPVATCHLATTCCCRSRSHSPRRCAAKLTKLPLGNLLKSPFAVCTGLTKHISVSFTGQNEEKKKKNKAREISEKRSPKYRTTTTTTRRRGKRETSWWRPETQLHKQATRVKIACNLFGSNFIEAQKFARPQKFRHRHRRSPAPELSLALSLAFRLYAVLAVRTFACSLPSPGFTPLFASWPNTVPTWPFTSSPLRTGNAS